MIRRILTRTKIRIRLAALHAEAWAIRKLWVGDWVSREDALEDVDADMRQLRFRLRPYALHRHNDEAMKQSARNMIPPDTEE